DRRGPGGAHAGAGRVARGADLRGGVPGVRLRRPPEPADDGRVPGRRVGVGDGRAAGGSGADGGGRVPDHQPLLGGRALAAAAAAGGAGGGPRGAHAPRPHRPAHRPRQPQALRRGARLGDVACGTARGHVEPGHHRPGPLQGLQRPPWASRGGRRAADGGVAAADAGARARHGGPAGRRGVRRADGGRLPRGRLPHGRAHPAGGERAGVRRAHARHREHRRGHGAGGRVHAGGAGAGGGPGAVPGQGGRAQRDRGRREGRGGGLV
ncbi:MAG: diguanylate cyclase/phosphodiesterase (GGDEF & EAL domains) with PAS/PAC sensor(s), partial [uncultured Gemmatimonadetes bacterium]